jgi:L-2,4-diaminobutyrate decarboxylase
MHEFDESTDDLAWAIFRYALDRVKTDPPLDGPRSHQELWEAVGQTITEDGIGGESALAAFADHLAPACLSADHPRFLSFVPGAPTNASVLFDLVVGASAMCATSWLEAAGTVYAENQALRWVADLVGLPEGAGGCFASGGTMGNLSALIAARDDAMRRREAEGSGRPVRWAVVVSDGAHSSIDSAARVMDVDVLLATTGDDRRLRGDEVRAAIAARPEGTEVFAVVATAGTTNLGVVDALDEVAEATAEHGAWFHVDGAYGGAALAAGSVRSHFAGIERCDSVVIDPHKWLFAPFDCCALLYRQPEVARLAHAQHASYLDPINSGSEWNPTDYGHFLTRRARGLPFWFSLAVHGTSAYSEAVERTLEVTLAGAELMDSAPHVELIMDPVLSVLAFRRVGWEQADYDLWSARLMEDGTAFVLPTQIDGEPALRICIVNPLTTVDDIAMILDSLA